MQNLKEVYEKKKLEELAKKLGPIDESVKQSTLILEKLDQNEVKKIGKVIEDLESIVPSSLPTLEKAINAAKSELMNTFKGGLLQKITNFFTPEFAKPLTKALAFCSGLYNGFSQLPTLMKTVVPAGEKNKTLKVSEVIGDDKKKIDNFKAAFIETIKPDGLFAAAFGMPYLGGTDIKFLAEEMMDLSIQEVEGLARTIPSKVRAATTSIDAKEIEKAAEVAPSDKDQEKPGEAPQTTPGAKPKQTIKTKANFIKAFNALNAQDKLDPEKIYSLLVTGGALNQ